VSSDVRIALKPAPRSRLVGAFPRKSAQPYGTPRGGGAFRRSAPIDPPVVVLTGRNIDVSGQRERPAVELASGVRESGQMIGP